MDNGAMMNSFGGLKIEMFYGEQFNSVEDFIHALDDYIHYYNNDRISLKLKGMSPVQYRTHSQAS
jgi:putative transposase